MAVQLTDAQVVELRERYAAGARQTELAREYGIAQNSVSAIVTGRTRAAAGGPIAERTPRGPAAAPAAPRMRLTEETVAEVKRRVGDGERRAEVAAALGISKHTVDSIMSGRRTAKPPTRGIGAAAAQRIRELSGAGHTQTEIARRMGVSQQVVSRVVRGELYPDARRPGS